MQSEPFLKLEICDSNGQDDLTSVEFEILPTIKSSSERIKDTIDKELSEIDNELNIINQQVCELNKDIEPLTNHADGLDYAIAVICGIISGMIDSFVVGKWDFKKAKGLSNKKINEKVISFAKKDPDYVKKYTEDESNRLANAISFLEKKYKLPGDGDFTTISESKISASSHHIDDFCHHPTFMGLLCCILVQFKETATYHAADGNVFKVPVKVNEYGEFVGENLGGKIFSGFVNWIFKIAKTVSNRKGHLYSDMAGSYNSAKKKHDGMGLPGSIMSTIKELASLPCFKDKNFAENLRKAFQNGIGTGKSQLDLKHFNCLFEGASSKFDMRTEMAIGHELKRQTLPIMINEFSVRAFYFVRRFISEMKETSTIFDINWNKVIPFGNRTISRMITISSGVFTAVDLVDAGIRAAVETGGVNYATIPAFILRVNFVGIGRFAVAVVTDCKMGIAKNNLENEKLKLQTEELRLLNAKVFYKEASMWCSALEAGRSIENAIAAMKSASKICIESYIDIADNIQDITPELVSKVNEKNNDIIEDALDILEF